MHRYHLYQERTKLQLWTLCNYSKYFYEVLLILCCFYPSTLYIISSLQISFKILLVKSCIILVCLCPQCYFLYSPLMACLESYSSNFPELILGSGSLLFYLFNCYIHSEYDNFSPTKCYLWESFYMQFLEKLNVSFFWEASGGKACFLFK